MNDISVIIGGKAGDGINSAGATIAQLINHMGYSLYLYFDYPSLIRGGHNYAIIRGTDRPESPGTHSLDTDFLLALDQATVDQHAGRQQDPDAIIFNADLVRSAGQGVPVKTILQELQAPEIMGNSALIGGFAKAAGIGWDVVEEVFRSHIPKAADKNLQVARRAYDLLKTVKAIPRGTNPPRPLVTGNEAIGLGLVQGGLDAYVSYPMTPSSGILHFLAAEKDRFGITVLHPENEIAVILMALGFAAAGKKAAVGTSGGGFCLMTEGLSLAGMAEVPVVIVMSQRTGPSTGLPTYTGQADLRFVIHAGQGEFPRFIVAPGNAEEAVVWSARAMDLAWRCQVPSFILSDKTLSEGTYSMPFPGDPGLPGAIPGWDGAGEYRRYAITPGGVSPLAAPGTKGAVVKVNSYAHDEDGITTEEAGAVVRMAGKRTEKEESLRRELAQYEQVRVSGSRDSSTALLAWGSPAGACTLAGEALGLLVVRPVVLWPFPGDALRAALGGVNRVIAVEENQTGQFADLATANGIAVSDRILKYDGRPFVPDELVGRIKEVLR